MRVIQPETTLLAPMDDDISKPERAWTMDAIGALFKTLGAYVTHSLLDLFQLLGKSVETVLDWLRSVGANANATGGEHAVLTPDVVDALTPPASGAIHGAVFEDAIEEEEDELFNGPARGDAAPGVTNVLEEEDDEAFNGPANGDEAPGFTNVRFCLSTVASCRETREKRRATVIAPVRVDDVPSSPFTVANVVCGCPLRECPNAIDVADAWAALVASGVGDEAAQSTALHRIVMAVATLDETILLDVPTLAWMWTVLMGHNGDEDKAFAEILSMPTIPPPGPPTDEEVAPPRARD